MTAVKPADCEYPDCGYPHCDCDFRPPADCEAEEMTLTANGVTINLKGRFGPLLALIVTSILLYTTTNL